MPSADPNSRIAWMDSLRGAAMLLLLSWHAAAIPAFYGWNMPEWLFLANEVFLPWRMPTLMFLSGLLLARSLAKPLTTFYLGKVRSLLWPYVLWAGLHLLTFPTWDVSDVVHPTAWIATGYLWFIFYLLVYYCVAPVVARIPWWLTIPAAAAGALVIDHAIVHALCYFAVFFFAGYHLRGVAHRVAEVPRVWVVLAGVVSVGFTAVSLWLTDLTDTHFFKYDTVVIPFAIVLIFVSVRAANLLQARAGSSLPMRGLAWVGRHSVVFYLTHFPLIALICTTVGLLGGRLGLWIVAVDWIVAVAAGVGIAVLARRAPVSWLFVAPGGRRRSGENSKRTLVEGLTMPPRDGDR